MSATLSPAAEAGRSDRVEVIDGHASEPLPMSAYASAIANRLNIELVLYSRSARTGQPMMDMFFRLPVPGDTRRVRKPDVAFVSFDRWPADRPLPYRGNPMDVVPDLMVEVVSPTDQAEEMVGKAREYIQAGARLVWVVYPAGRELHAYTATPQVRVYSVAEELDGGEVLPGFRVPMSGLFPPVEGLPVSESDE